MYGGRQYVHREIAAVNRLIHPTMAQPSAPPPSYGEATQYGGYQPPGHAPYAAQSAPAGGDGQPQEGILTRKHEWESTTKKASSRCWDNVFCTLQGASLAFYKDQKHAKSDPSAYFHHEQPINLKNASSSIASDYTKRPHVFRLQLDGCGDYLFQCKDDEEMNGWINKLNAVSGTEGKKE